MKTSMNWMEIGWNIHADWQTKKHKESSAMNKIGELKKTFSWQLVSSLHYSDVNEAKNITGYERLMYNQLKNPFIFSHEDLGDSQWWSSGMSVCNNLLSTAYK